MSMKLRLIIFDVDGTLVDSQSLIHAAMGRAFRTLALPPPDQEAVRAIIGLSLPEVFRRLSAGSDPAQHEALAREYVAAVTAIHDEQGAGAVSPLYPGIRLLLERLQKHPETLLGVATGKSRRGLDHVIQAHGLQHYFTTCQVADAHPSKPHPAMLHAALSETGCTPSQAVMIGDTSYDMQMAQAAGMTAVGVDWGYHETRCLQDAGAQFMARDADDLGRIICQIFPEV